MTKQEEIAAFVERNVTWPRGRFFFREELFPWEQIHYQYSGDPQQIRPKVETVATEFLRNAEFRALRLGTWLGTAQGEVISQGVEMVSPPFYRQDIELLVDALQLAAKMQNKKIAGLVAFGAIGSVAALALIAGSGSDQAA